MAVEYKPIVLDETIKQHFEKVDEQTNKLISSIIATIEQDIEYANKNTW